MRVTPYVAIVAIPLTAGCAPILHMVGSGASALQAAVQVDRLRLLADGVSYASSQKTVTDHLLSKMTDQDCKLWNVMSATAVCAAKPATAALPPIESSDPSRAVTAAQPPAPTLGDARVQSGARSVNLQVLPLFVVASPSPPPDSTPSNPPVMRTNIYTELRVH
jgi:hypothetical protein